MTAKFGDFLMAPSFENLTPNYRPSVRAFIEETLKRISYKPGWRIRLNCDWNRFWIEVHRMEVDSDNPKGPQVPIYSTLELPFQVFELKPERMAIAITKVVYDTIKVAELHEIDEWLRIDGEHVYPPHPEEVRFKNVEPVYLKDLETSNLYEQK